ncbi:DUF6519 domain-containing protein [Streptomyces sp. 5.8]|uniref:DUF6519 domain-containing protein n=1 Tax=Streptomyces sp. 5.8 TaxID=3406571 RepID=UPI003BB4D86B
MQGDFSRWTFDARARFRSVLLQQGRALLDADWNEQTKITAHHDETRALDTFGRSGAPAAGNAFRITDKDGNPPKGTPWEDLRISPGRMYVDGVLVEAHGEGEGIPLNNQPDRATIGETPGLAEPTKDTRHAFYLNVHAHHVTVDEVEGLRESALGGPDTTTRDRTVWQVTYREVQNETTVCSNLHRATGKPPARGLMAASVEAEAPGNDPCAITAAGSYTRLENQLYRVQIHEKAKTFLWSRENGSVTASLVGISKTALPAGVDAELTVDRVGRDEELSIGHDDIVEVTSPARQLCGQSGYLARVKEPKGLRLPVVWLSGSGVGDIDSLGRAPIVRRWEGGPTTVTTPNAPLENGIWIDFDAEAALETGDYWLIPARTARLAYGLNATNGSLEWPKKPKSTNAPMYLPPHGPARHVTPLAILKRDTPAGGVSTWTLESDCRPIAPTLTQLTTIDLVGGDGQEAIPGKELAKSVRVVVRNGNLPVEGAPVLFTPKKGSVRTKPGAALAPGEPTLTDKDGVASVWWTLDPAGSNTQTLEAQRLNDSGQGTDVKVIVTGRMSKAEGVAWDPPEGCTAFKHTKTVKEALDGLVQARKLRLLGGDGQQLPSADKVLPQRVRVIVDSACGPVKGAKVTAAATTGALVDEAPSAGAHPSDLTGASATATGVTAKDGSAAFWWQPSFGADGSDVLSISQAEDVTRAPVTVTAQAAPPSNGSQTSEGLHIRDLIFRLGARPFLNDDRVSLDELSNGIQVNVSEEVDPKSLSNRRGPKPVVRVILEFPWPLSGEAPQLWSDVEHMPGQDRTLLEQPIAFRSTMLDADVSAEGTTILWAPRDPDTMKRWLHYHFVKLEEYMSWDRPIEGRFQIDGWAVIAEEDKTKHLNGRVNAFLDGEYTRLTPTTENEVTGSRFEQWFWLARD